MGFQEFKTFWPSSLAGAACGVLSLSGVVVAVQTDRDGLGATLIAAGFALLVVAVVVALKFRRSGQPF